MFFIRMHVHKDTRIAWRVAKTVVEKTFIGLPGNDPRRQSGSGICSVAGTSRAALLYTPPNEPVGVRIGKKYPQSEVNFEEAV